MELIPTTAKYLFSLLVPVLRTTGLLLLFFKSARLTFLLLLFFLVYSHLPSYALIFDAILFVSIIYYC